jgi:hypothetical protein
MGVEPGILSSSRAEKKEPKEKQDWIKVKETIITQRTITKINK